MEREANTLLCAGNSFSWTRKVTSEKVRDSNMLIRSVCSWVLPWWAIRMCSYIKVSDLNSTIVQPRNTNFMSGTTFDRSNFLWLFLHIQKTISIIYYISSCVHATISHYVSLSVCLSVGLSHFTFGPQIKESKEEEEAERQWKPMGEGWGRG